MCLPDERQQPNFPTFIPIWRLNEELKLDGVYCWDKIFWRWGDASLLRRRLRSSYSRLIEIPNQSLACGFGHDGHMGVFGVVKGGGDAGAGLFEGSNLCVRK